MNGAPGVAGEPMGPPSVELATLGLAEGGHVLVALGLSRLEAGARLRVGGSHPELAGDLGAWARSQGHTTDGPVIVKGRAGPSRWQGAERAGDPGTGRPSEAAAPWWGLAPRGALVELGGPAWEWSDLTARHQIWGTSMPRLYEQALAGQWDPATAIGWDEPFELGDDIEGAVVQVMTYLVENELAALVIPSRFVGRVHPHFREVLQLLAVQAADEARHVEVFTRRALLRRPQLGTSSVGGRASLGTLLDERDFSVAAFLLSVLGEGTFLQLLSFLESHAPDPVTRRICHLVRQDEARPVAAAMGHLGEQVAAEPAALHRLADAVQRRHDALASTAGLNTDVFDALVLMAAGSLAPAAVRSGFAAVSALMAEMDGARRRRLQWLGFGPDDAAALSSLHTRNFM